MMTCACNHTKSKHRWKKISFSSYSYACTIPDCRCQHFNEDLSKRTGFVPPGAFPKRERLMSRANGLKRAIKALEVTVTDS